MRLPNLVIPNTGTVSAGVDILHIEDLTIYGPATLTGVIDIEVSPDDGVTWFTLALAVAAAGRTPVLAPQASQIRLTSTIAEGAERLFPVHGSDKKRA